MTFAVILIAMVLSVATLALAIDAARHGGWYRPRHLTPLRTRVAATTRLTLRELRELAGELNDLPPEAHLMASRWGMF